MWNKDQIQGKMEKAKGSIKEVIGTAAGATKLKAAGQRQELKGKVQEGYGSAKQIVGAALENLGRQIKH